MPQEAIAIELELTREQVRRFQREYEHTLHTGRLTAPERFDTARRIIIDRARLLDVDQLFEIVDQLHKQVHAKIEES
ncbi:hypothetical protein ABGB12_12065 [Actinocorallia sp. B10E7]|uniref:hypothetical protein n=1 Tax=Actinocorallia sp. B10E7 TaxID=3153558 RepID=UPI00325F8FE7